MQIFPLYKPTKSPTKMETPLKFPLPFCAALLASLAAPLPALGGVSMAPLASFSSNGDGWLAPGESDQTFLGTGSLERGLAYNPVTGHLLLVSRNGGVSVRILNAVSGAELGTLANPNGFSGGIFAGNMIGTAADGAIYLANLQTNISTGSYKVYRWKSETAEEPTIFFDSTVPDLTGTFRAGDSFDVTGSGLDTRLVAGFSGGTGYLVVNSLSGPAPDDPPEGAAVAITSFSPAGVAAGDFRLGITFGKDGASHVWGRQTSGAAVRRTSFTGSTGTYQGALPVTAAGEASLDYALIGGRPLFAVLNINAAGGDAAVNGGPVVRLYDVTDPASPTLAVTGMSASGILTANGNGVGSIKWGKITSTAAGTTATLYAMSTNQGIQAFTVTVTPEISPVAIVTDPANANVFERGLATFKVSASGTPPLSYQWLKDGATIAGATTSTLKIFPVAAGDAGAYSCRVNNAAAAPATSNAANLITVASVNSGALTECWQLTPGSRQYLTEGDTQRGLGYNPTSNRLFLATRTPAVGIIVLNATDGSQVSVMDVSAITGGTFPLNHVATGTDGKVYATNLSNTATGGDYKIYEWANDSPATPSSELFNGNPLATRIGDTFAVRGGGATVEMVAGARNTDQFAILKYDRDGIFQAYPVTIAGAAPGAFGIGIAFGQGNTIWGKNGGSGLTLAAYDVDASGLPVGTGSVIATFGTSVLPGAGGVIAVDNVNGLLAHIHTGDSDNVRLYGLPVPLPDPPPVNFPLLDQEFFSNDNPNANGTGQLAFGNNKLFAINTNNGLVCYTVVKPQSVPPTITSITRSGNNLVISLNGTVGRTYLIEKSSTLIPAAAWSEDGTVTFTTATQSIIRPINAGEPKLFYRMAE